MNPHLLAIVGRIRSAVTAVTCTVLSTTTCAVELSYSNPADFPRNVPESRCLTETCTAGSFAFFVNRGRHQPRFFTSGEEACVLAMDIPGSYWAQDPQQGEGCWTPEYVTAQGELVPARFWVGAALRRHTCHGMDTEALIGSAVPPIADQPRCIVCGPGRIKPRPSSEACTIPLDRYHDKPQLACDVRAGNPIYPLTGVKRQPEHLGTWFVGRPVTLQYDTRRMLPGGQSPFAYSARPAPSFGALWESTLHKRLVLQTNDGVHQAVQASRGAGQWVSFSRYGASYVTDSDIVDKLAALPTGWRYVDAAARAQETYDTQGVLQRVNYAAGGYLQYNYSDGATAPEVAPGPGLLIKVEDSFGRAVHFQYEASGAGPRISRIIDADGQTTTPGYNGAGNLTRLAWPDTKVRQFLYEQSDLPWAMTGVMDENGARHSTYRYDDEGRATSTELADGTNLYSVTYSSAPRWLITQAFELPNTLVRDHSWQLPQGTTLTQPNGSSASYGAALVNGMPRVTSATQPAGSGCAASTSSQAYDANGNTVSRIDFNGSKSCHEFDLNRNLETARVEGLASSDTCPSRPATYSIPANSTQRKVSRQWHPDWPLTVQLAEAKKIITSIYNGQPDPTAGGAIASCAPTSAVLPDGKRIAVLCKKVEQATTDATGTQGFGATPSGTPRTWTYTYNQHGQVLTQRDPRNNLTTYAYYTDTNADHTHGDLQSVTNAAGHATQYTRYDRSGRLLRSVDPNGGVTETTYTPRGWVGTVTVSRPGGGTSQLTSYEYDGVGQLKAATLPDSTKLEYSYDAAHRLTSVKDAAGNTVSYTLDNMGNRTAEQTKDPSGVLARSITRVYDALNRVQSVNGVQQ